MRLWSREFRWVNDENGLRCYFSEPDLGGPSRLECYCRLLGQSASAARPRGLVSFRPTAGLHVADLLAVLKRRWRSQAF